MSSLFIKEWQFNAPGLICPGCLKWANCFSAEHNHEPFDGMITLCICGTKLKIIGTGKAMEYVKATKEDIKKLDKKNRRRLQQYEIAAFLVKRENERNGKRK